MGIHVYDKVIYMPPKDAIVGADWRKASRSVNNGACVEVASAPTAVLVRDSTNRSGIVVDYGPQTWRLFIAATKADTFHVAN